MVGSLQVRFILSNHRTGFRVPNMTKSRHSDLIDNHIFRSAEVGSGILLYPVLTHNHGHRTPSFRVFKLFKRPQRPSNDQEGNFTADGPRLASGESPDFCGLEASTTRRLSYSLLAAAQSRTCTAIELQRRQSSLRAPSVLDCCYPLPKIRRFESYSVWISLYQNMTCQVKLWVSILHHAVRPVHFDISVQHKYSGYSTCSVALPTAPIICALLTSVQQLSGMGDYANW